MGRSKGFTILNFYNGGLKEFFLMQLLWTCVRSGTGIGG